MDTRSAGSHALTYTVICFAPRRAKTRFGPLPRDSDVFNDKKMMSAAVRIADARFTNAIDANGQLRTISPLRLRCIRKKIKNRFVDQGGRLLLHVVSDVGDQPNETKITPIALQSIHAGHEDGEADDHTH